MRRRPERSGPTDRVRLGNAGRGQGRDRCVPLVAAARCPEWRGPHPMHRAARPCGAFRLLLPPPPGSPRGAPHSRIGNPHCPPPFPAMPMQRKRCRAPSASPARRQPATAQGRARGPAIPVAPSSRLAFSRIGAAPRRGDHAKWRPLRRRENLARTPPALAARAQVSLHGPRAAGSAPARSRRRPPTNGKNGWRSGRRNDAVCGGGAAARIDARQARGRRARIAGVQSVRRSRRRCRCRCRRSALRLP